MSRPDWSSAGSDSCYYTPNGLWVVKLSFERFKIASDMSCSKKWWYMLNLLHLAPEKTFVWTAKVWRRKEKNLIRYTNFTKTAAGCHLHLREVVPPIDPHVRPVITFCLGEMKEVDTAIKLLCGPSVRSCRHCDIGATTTGKTQLSVIKIKWKMFYSSACLRSISETLFRKTLFF